MQGRMVMYWRASTGVPQSTPLTHRAHRHGHLSILCVPNMENRSLTNSSILKILKSEEELCSEKKQRQRRNLSVWRSDAGLAPEFRL